MSKLIAQIMLAILLFPLAGLVYFITFVVYLESRNSWSRYNTNVGFLVAGIMSWAFIAAYWISLYAEAYSGPQRRTLTVASALAAAIAGGVLGAVVHELEREVGFFIGTTSAPLLWQVATILIWRETDAECAHASPSRGMAGGLVCPTCGYNLSGLKGTRCPECGSEFTLDALVASQPANRQAEVER